jgi:hypothetical protein
MADTSQKKKTAKTKIPGQAGAYPLRWGAHSRSPPTPMPPCPRPPPPPVFVPVSPLVCDVVAAYGVGVVRHSGCGYKVPTLLGRASRSGAVIAVRYVRCLVVG